jgi:SAM-dependent methyltransferase
MTPKEAAMSGSVTERVREKYAQAASAGLGGVPAGAEAIARAFGYTPEELAALPEGANLGLSCGNPTATANLRPGEVVVDLGCGGGLDVLLAARKVGPAGKAVGIDMTPEMLELALNVCPDVGNRPPADSGKNTHVLNLEKCQTVSYLTGLPLITLTPSRLKTVKA